MKKIILKDINATFRAGRTALISGATGAGKSTLLHILAGLLRPTEGEVLAGRQPVSRWITRHRDYWRRHVGIIFQHAILLDDLTVLENVMLPLIPRNVGFTKLRKQAVAMLERLNMAHLAAKNAALLSGGERQKISVARALISRPAIVIADEPTAHQDDQNMLRVLENLVSGKAWNATIVIAAHDPRIFQSDQIDDRYDLMDGHLSPKPKETSGRFRGF